MLVYPGTFTDGARTIMFHARRLGHTHTGGEHFLLALAAAGVPAATALCEHGVTPGRVEEEIVRLGRRCGPRSSTGRPAEPAAPHARARRSTGPYYCGSRCRGQSRRLRGQAVT